MANYKHNHGTRPEILMLVSGIDFYHRLQLRTKALAAIDANAQITLLWVGIKSAQAFIHARQVSPAAGNCFSPLWWEINLRIVLHPSGTQRSEVQTRNLA